MNTELGASELIAQIRDGKNQHISTGYKIKHVDWNSVEKHRLEHVDRTLGTEKWAELYQGTVVLKNYQSEARQIVNSMVKSFVHSGGRERRIVLCCSPKSRLADQVLRDLKHRTTGLNTLELTITKRNNITTIMHGRTVMQIAKPRTLINVLRGCDVDELHVSPHCNYSKNELNDIRFIKSIVGRRPARLTRLNLPDFKFAEISAITGEEECKSKQKRTIGSLKLEDL